MITGLIVVSVVIIIIALAIYSFGRGLSGKKIPWYFKPTNWLIIQIFNNPRVLWIYLAIIVLAIIIFQK